jgi:hypothetical protein
VEWRLFIATWNVKRNWARAKFLAQRLFNLQKSSPATNWRQDGSREQSVPATISLNFVRKSPFVLHEVYLARDMERLAVLANGQVRVIMYESPVDPDNDANLRATPTEAALSLRKKFLQKCLDFGFQCHEAPRLEAPDGTPWVDCCHAPAETLGRYVRRLM